MIGMCHIRFAYCSAVDCRFVLAIVRTTLNINQACDVWQEARKEAIVTYVQTHLPAAIKAQRDAGSDSTKPEEAVKLVRVR